MPVGQSIYPEERPPGRSLKPLAGKTLPKSESLKQLLRTEKQRKEEIETRHEIESIRKERIQLEAEERKEKSRLRQLARGVGKAGAIGIRGIGWGYRSLKESSRKEREFQRKSRRKKKINF